MVRKANLPVLLTQAALKFSAAIPNACSQDNFAQLRTLVEASGGHVSHTFTHRALSVNSPTRSLHRPVDMPTVAGVCSQGIETPATHLGFGSQRLAGTGWAFTGFVEDGSTDHQNRTSNDYFTQA